MRSFEIDMISDRLKKSQEKVRRELDPHFSWVENDTIPFTALAQPVAKSHLAYITSCGLYRTDTQLPFDAWNHLGDPSFREIHIDTPVDRLKISHAHFQHEHIEEDVNVALPIAHLQQMAAEGEIGQFYHWVYGFMGYLPQPWQFLAETVPTITRRLKADQVDAVLFTPC